MFVNVSVQIVYRIVLESFMLMKRISLVDGGFSSYLLVDQLLGQENFTFTEFYPCVCVDWVADDVISDNNKINIITSIRRYK